MTIQVGMGATAGDEISLKSSLIRSKTLTIFGYGNLDASLDKRATASRHMAELAGQGRLIVPVERIPLRQVARALRRSLSPAR